MLMPTPATAAPLSRDPSHPPAQVGSSANCFAALLVPPPRDADPMSAPPGKPPDLNGIKRGTTMSTARNRLGLIKSHSNPNRLHMDLGIKNSSIVPLFKPSASRPSIPLPDRSVTTHGARWFFGHTVGGDPPDQYLALEFPRAAPGFDGQFLLRVIRSRFRA